MCLHCVQAYYNHVGVIEELLSKTSVNLDVVDDNGEHLLELSLKCKLISIPYIQVVLHWTLLPFRGTGEQPMVAYAYSNKASVDMCLLQGHCGAVIVQQWHFVCVRQCNKENSFTCSWLTYFHSYTSIQLYAVCVVTQALHVQER